MPPVPASQLEGRGVGLIIVNPLDWSVWVLDSVWNGFLPMLSTLVYVKNWFVLEFLP